MPEMLSDEEIEVLAMPFGMAHSTTHRYARAVESAVLRRVKETVEETKTRRPGDSHSGRRYAVTAGEGYLLACNDIIRELTAKEQP